MKGISVSSLTAGYGGRTVLRDISGVLPAGAVTFILGPNGSGKSTLLRTLGGALPFRGRIRFSGRDAASLSSRERGRLLGVVTQSPSLNFPFTVEEVITMGRLPHRSFLKKDEGGRTAVSRASREMELEELRDRPLPSLSGGERQRTMIAQVIAQEPEIFLLDEPSSALDPNHALKLFRFLERMAAEGKTVAAAAHDINLAAEFGSFVWIMKEGRLAAAGKTGDVLKGDILSSVYGSTFVPYRREWTDFSGPAPARNGGEKILWRAV